MRHACSICHHCLDCETAAHAHAAGLQTTSGPARWPDELTELLGFPPGWRSRVAQVDAPRRATRAFYADLRARRRTRGEKAA